VRLDDDPPATPVLTRVPGLHTKLIRNSADVANALEIQTAKLSHKVTFFNAQRFSSSTEFLQQRVVKVLVF
jgi:hypothetical protein